MAKFEKSTLLKAYYDISTCLSSFNRKNFQGVNSLMNFIILIGWWLNHPPLIFILNDDILENLAMMTIDPSSASIDSKCTTTGHEKSFS